MAYYLYRSAWAHFVAILFFWLLCVPSSYAQVKDYRYQRINTDIKVNTDTTLSVREQQDFLFVGGFHAATRDIPLNTISEVTDIKIYDVTSNSAYRYSWKRLDKLDPASWGKYTTWREGNVRHIEWYYDVSNAAHSWSIEYRVHGALEFLSKADRLYWNIFSDDAYSVPVDMVSVRVDLPEDISPKDIMAVSYRSAGTSSQQPIINRGQAVFSGFQFSPHEAFTIDLSWPRGSIDRNAFWRDFFVVYWGYALALFVVVGTGVWLYIFWYMHEKSKEKGPIIPEYEPPQRLRPAIAEVIAKERLTNKALPATIIDLAVRGYINISEEPVSVFARFRKLIIGAGLLVLFLFYSYGRQEDFFGAITLFLLVYFFIFLLLGWNRVPKRDYVLTMTKLRAELEKNVGVDIEGYELNYMEALFRHGVFSTKKLRHDREWQSILFRETNAIKEDILKTTNTKTNAYEVSPAKEKNKNLIYMVLAGVLAVLFVGGYVDVGNQVAILCITLCTSAIVAWTFVRYDARLTDEGAKLKKEWLGFKLYLETAERYRMQNLTPEIFEKYLPYAIIFGVEKKWARAFEDMNIPAPGWYASSGGGFSINSVGSGGFSPSTFSASFSSSFMSTFASSGGGGGGGGGGGAGGGGGGGGGGAS